MKASLSLSYLSEYETNEEMAGQASLAFFSFEYEINELAYHFSQLEWK